MWKIDICVSMRWERQGISPFFIITEQRQLLRPSILLSFLPFNLLLDFTTISTFPSLSFFRSLFLYLYLTTYLYLRINLIPFQHLQFSNSRDVPLVSLRRTTSNTTPGIGGGPRSLLYNSYNKAENNVLITSDAEVFTSSFLSILLSCHLISSPLMSSHLISFHRCVRSTLYLWKWIRLIISFSQLIFADLRYPLSILNILSFLFF